MLRKILILAVLALLVLGAESIPGGYKKATAEQIQNMRFEQQFLMAQMTAREGFQEKHNIQLGELKEVWTQIVAGVNYKMIFETPNGDYEIIVFAQHWTQTYDISSISLIQQTL